MFFVFVFCLCTLKLHGKLHEILSTWCGWKNLSALPKLGIVCKDVGLIPGPFINIIAPDGPKILDLSLDSSGLDRNVCHAHFKKCCKLHIVFLLLYNYTLLFACHSYHLTEMLINKDRCNVKNYARDANTFERQ